MITATINENGNLVLTADEESRQELKELFGAYTKQTQYVSEQLHEYYDFIDPEHVGALTDSLILIASDDYDIDDDDSYTFYDDEPKVYWFPNYCVENEWDTLAETGKVIFQRNNDD